MLKVNAFQAAQAATLGERDRALVERRARLLGPAYQLFYDRPLHLVRGQGAELFDAEGRGYLDLYNNVPSVGHCHPHVVRALSEQAATLNTHTRYLHETLLDYAEALLATFPEALDHLMLTCTGSEANDLAWRIARGFTGGSGIIVTRTAYHGITDAVAQFSPSRGASVDLGRHVAPVPAPGDPGAACIRGVSGARWRRRSPGCWRSARYCRGTAPAAGSGPRRTPGRPRG